MEGNYKNWDIQKDNNHVIWAGLNKDEKVVNSINDAVLDELEQIVLETNNNASGLVIYSLKKTGFIAGADIQSLTDVQDINVILKFIHKGQKIFNQLEQLTIPTIALINGFCLGGGMELALACHYRIAIENDKTQLGLPEIKLGIHPGWGGTVRLPKLIDPKQALQMMLTGASINGAKAKKIGLVDEYLPERQINAAVKQITQGAYKKKRKPIPRYWNARITRQLMGSFALRNLQKKGVKEKHYPAFFQLIKHFENTDIYAKTAMDKEATSFGELLKGETPKNLIRLFSLQERLKAIGKQCKVDVKQVHVVGAGTMGAGIAAWCALKGCRVTLQDTNHKTIAQAIKQANSLFKKKLKLPYKVSAALDRLIPDVNGYGIKKADVVIEAIFEDAQAKQALFKELEGKIQPHTLIATNTSTFPLAELRTTMQNPERLVGIHFFNPVAQMQLVEIVHDETVSKSVVEQACAFVGKIGKLPLPVASIPGFLVNRVLMPYLMECVDMLSEGHEAEDIDNAAKDFGMLMGPVELSDVVGLDICLHAAESLQKHFPIKIPELLKEKVKNKELGKKTNKGFFSYKKGKKITKESTKTIDENLKSRLILRLINETMACIREGIVKDGDLADAGLVFGAGFAPFTGGPIHYAKGHGINNIKEELNKLEGEFGKRFLPDVGWKDIVNKKEVCDQV